MIALHLMQNTNLVSMKHLVILLLFIGLGWSIQAQEIDMKRIDFVNSFYKAVASHNQKKVIKHLDKNYRTEQLAFLKGNKEQFVNELFGGTDINSNEWVNLKLNEIDNIEIQDVFDRGENEWEYVFHVTSGEKVLKVPLTLKQSGKKLGFVSAVG